jgi:hypothetical protein
MAAKLPVSSFWLQVSGPAKSRNQKPETKNYRAGFAALGSDPVSLCRRWTCAEPPGSKPEGRRARDYIRARRPC